MILKNLFLFILALYISAGLTAQTTGDKADFYLENFGEVNLAVSKTGVEVDNLSAFVSVYNVTADSVFFNVNSTEFLRFLKMNKKYRVVDRPKALQSIVTASSVNQVLASGFNAYPAYQQYDSIMHKFAADYPSVCQFVNLGTLPSGRKILAVHISDNVSQNEAEPRFLYTSTMHGDEVTGYIFMLKLIDTLLSSYGVDSSLTAIVNSTDIWINPLANPDGTYAGGNNTVSGATRRNANHIDLNRNYPDPRAGQHPDGNVWQPETNIFMNFADTMHFTMAANFHGGAELVNYPWDTWTKLTADDSWWRFVSREYADTAHFYNNYQGYFTQRNNGITNGAQWYVITGGRQDFMNYFEHCREVTIEVSSTKTIPEYQLPYYWQWSAASIINYLKQVNYGLRGVVTDKDTGTPLYAGVLISSHDKDSSRVFTRLPFGDYYRLLDSGYYDVTFYSAGYYSKTIDSVHITRYDTTLLNVELKKKPDFISRLINKEKVIPVFPNPASSVVNFIYDKQGAEAVIVLYDQTGNAVKEFRVKGSSNLYTIDVSDLSQGVYYFTIATSCSRRPAGGKFVVKK